MPTTTAPRPDLAPAPAPADYADPTFALLADEPPGWAAPTAAIRQRRRLSWAERLRRHALDGEVSLRLVAATQGAAAWLVMALQIDVIA